jgi:glycosyltransferase involved in cell wall biosynthesis
VPPDHGRAGDITEENHVHEQHRTMVVLLPVYQPSHHLPTLMTELRRQAPRCRFVIVDDGSGPAAAEVLRQAENLGGTVLRHPANRGKGAALKTGFRYAQEQHPGLDVVCADADGQHSVADIARVADRVRDTGHTVLGVRRFAENVPLRSKVGNTVTQVLFRAATGRGVQDTQTGLRAYPASLLGWLRTVPGERFEYEMNVLLEAARAAHRIEEVVITTTYLDDNASSHFSVLSDSARIYWPLLRYAAASLLAPARAAR